MQVRSPDVSVVIVNYNTKDLLAQCLRSVFEQTPTLKLEVIVVDNASADDSCRMVREEFATVRSIENEENMGFAKATNQGIRASCGRCILLLNPDTVVLDRAIERMVTFMDSQPRMGACGCKLVYLNGTFQRNAYPFPTLLGGLYQYSGLFGRVPLLARRLVPDWIDTPTDQTRPVDWCSGACLLVSRACINDVGLLDESFFLYTEEVDWCQRMWQSNWPVFYLAEAVVIHYLGASQNDAGQFSRRLRQLRSDLHYLRKWHGPMYAWAYQMVVRACSLYRYAKCHWRQLRATDRATILSQEAAFYRAIIINRF